MQTGTGKLQKLEGTTDLYWKLNLGVSIDWQSWHDVKYLKI